jgi:pimeloyl-ACP methyl ester carboxylesterase
MDVYAAPQRLVRIGRRRRLNLQIAGEGSPTVILSAGLAGINIDWLRVFPYVARFTRVVAHEHAGLGFSDPGRMPRTSAAIVADLRGALRAAGIAPPYVLAGHSAGGLHMRLFAAQHPDEVAGLVLVDTVTTHFEARIPGGMGLAAERRIWRRLERLARRGALTPDTDDYRQYVGVPQPGLSSAMNAAMHGMRTRPSYYRTLISESLALNGRGSEELAGLSQDLGDRPLIVLSAGRVAREAFIGGRADKAAAWYAMHDELAALSTRGERRTVDAGHNIPLENPRAVVGAIEAVVWAVRRLPAAKQTEPPG